MAGGNFMHRIISYVVNEVVVNGLANSPAFQRFAVRTSKNIEDISKKAIQKREELAEQLKDLPKKWSLSRISDSCCFAEENKAWFSMPQRDADEESIS